MQRIIHLLVSVLLAAAIPSVARADPQLGAGAQTMGRIAIPGSAFAGAGLWGGATWWDRLQLGVRVGAAAGSGVSFADALGEAGMWIHPSRTLDVLFAWRVGMAWAQVSNGAGGRSSVSGLAVEPTVEFAFHVTSRIDVRVAPLVMTAYREHVWQATLGADLGIGVRL
jgi:hypothetical protein